VDIRTEARKKPPLVVRNRSGRGCHSVCFERQAFVAVRGEGELSYLRQNEKL
jgi:hypothetical protein